MPKSKPKPAPATGPLAGIRVLELARLYPAPLGTMLMADMGADVIKIEDPHAPDYMRQYPPFVDGESAGFLAVNRGKRSLAVNVKHKAGRQIFFELLKTADIVVESFRPGVLDSLGLGYTEAHTVHPAIIYLSVTGYGQSGPYAQKAGHDLNYLGYAGILSLTGMRGSGPVMPGVQIADVAGGAYMVVIAALAALQARHRTGEGQHVDVSMLDGIMPLLTLQWAHFQASGGSPVRRGEALLSGGLACYNLYACADERYVALAALEAKFWQAFCEATGHPEWIPRQYTPADDQEQLISAVAEMFRSQPRAAWLNLASKYDCCLTPVLEMDELVHDAYLRERRMFSPTPPIPGIGVPLKFSRTPATPGRPAPKLGEHTLEILTELGYSTRRIRRLRNAGEIATAF